MSRTYAMLTLNAPDENDKINVCGSAMYGFEAGEKGTALERMKNFKRIMDKVYCRC